MEIREFKIGKMTIPAEEVIRALILVCNMMSDRIDALECKIAERGEDARQTTSK